MMAVESDFLQNLIFASGDCYGGVRFDFGTEDAGARLESIALALPARSTFHSIGPGSRWKIYDDCFVHGRFRRDGYALFSAERFL